MNASPKTVPISRNATMQANASEGAKVLPIARISIKKTGTLSTTAEARGNSSAGLQPPMRLRNQNSDGAYARENNSAAIVNEMTVTFVTSVNFARMSRLNIHEQSEMETSFTKNLSHD